ncbi:MAG: flagellin, partial [Terracidiphilus sp.]
GGTTINVNYLVKGANGTETTATTSISVSGANNTANGLISAINSSGLGLTASFTTQSQAGVVGGGSQTGIQISGGLVSAGVQPGTVSTSGVLNPKGITAENLTQGQVITIAVGGTTAFTTTINSATASLTGLANAINTSGPSNGLNASVTATVINNGNGSQSLSLADNASTSGALTVTFGTPGPNSNTLTTGTTNSANPVVMTVGASTPGKAGSEASVVLGLGASGTSSATDQLSGQISLSNAAAGTAASGIVFKMGTGAASGSGAGTLLNGTFTVNGNTLGNLATAIASQLGNGATATVGTNGITITSGTPGTTLQQVGASTLSAVPNLNATSNVAGATATNGSDGSTSIALNGGNGSFNGGDGLTGKIIISNGTAAVPGTPMTFTMGTAAAAPGGGQYTTGASTVNGLVAAINANTGTDGMSANLVGGKIVLTSNTTNSTITVSASATNPLVDTPDALAGTQTAAVPSVATPSANAGLKVVGQNGATNVTNINTDDVLTGNVVLSNGLAGPLAATATFTMGNVGATTGYGTTQVAVQGNTLSDLMGAINNATEQSATGITAAMNATGNGLAFTTALTGGQIGVTNNLADTSAMTHVATSNPSGGYAATVSLANGGAIPGTGTANSGALSGTVVITNNDASSGGGAVATTDTFVMGSGANTYAGVNGATNNVFYTGGTTLGSLVTAITTAASDSSNAGIAELGTTLVASLDTGASGGLVVTDTAATAQTVTSTLSNLLPAASETNAQGTNGAVGQGAATPATVNYATGGTMNAATDPIAGSIVLTSSAGGGAITYTVGGAAGGAAKVDATHFTTGLAAQTLNGLAAAITLANADQSTGLTAVASSTGLAVTAIGGATVLTQGTNTLTDTADSLVVSPTASVASGAVKSANAAVGTGVAAINNDQISGAGDTLTGKIVLSNGLGVTQGTDVVTYTMSSSATGATQSASYGTGNVTVAGTSVNALMAAINGNNTATPATDITASLNAAGTGLSFTATANGTSIAVNSTGLSDTSTMSFTTPPNGSNNLGQNLAGVIALTDGGKLGSGGAITGTVTVTNGTGQNAVTDTFVMGAASNSDVYAASGATHSMTATSLGALVTAINNAGSDTSNQSKGLLNLTASVDAATGGVFVQSTQAGATGLAANTAGLSVALAETGANGTNGAAGATNTAATLNYSNAALGTSNNAADPVTGSIVLTNVGNNGTGTIYGAGNSGANPNGQVTFHIGGLTSNNSATDVYTGTAAGAQTLQGLANIITTAGTSVASGGLGLDISATATSSGLTITSTDTGNASTLGSALTSVASTLEDQYGAVQGVQTGGTGPAGPTSASATVGTLGAIGQTDQLAGTIVISNGNTGAPGTAQTFVMGSTANVNGPTITTNGFTLNDLKNAINSDVANLGLQASVNNGALDLQATATNTTISVTSGATPLSDTVTENVLAPATGMIAAPSTALETMTGTLAGSDVMTGSIAISANGANSGNAITFVMGTSASQGGGAGSLSQNGNTFTVNGNTLQNLQTAVLNQLNVNVGISNSSGTGTLTMTSNVDSATAINITSAAGSLKDAGTNNPTSVSSLGAFAGLGDKVAGTVDFNLAGTPGAPVSFTIAANTTVQGLINEINTGSTTNSTGPDVNGVHAAYTQNATTGFYDVTLTSDTYGTAGDIQNAGAGTSVTDQTATATLAYTGAAAYNVGLSSTNLYDSSVGQTSVAPATMVSNSAASSGIATMSYSDGAGVSLAATDLSNQTDAQGSLTSLNSAITAVAAQDGYIGAQINTLNAVSQVLSTQQENVESAQNAVQATDYASATSSMSKYEILSQTGIAALAQANSVQQEVTKLLQ